MEAEGNNFEKICFYTTRSLNEKYAHLLLLSSWELHFNQVIRCNFFRTNLYSTSLNFLKDIIIIFCALNSFLPFLSSIEYTVLNQYILTKRAIKELEKVVHMSFLTFLSFRLFLIKYYASTSENARKSKRDCMSKAIQQRTVVVNPAEIRK